MRSTPQHTASVTAVGRAVAPTHPAVEAAIAAEHGGNAMPAVAGRSASVVALIVIGEFLPLPGSGGECRRT
jgi:hypothetical protein